MIAVLEKFCDINEIKNKDIFVKIGKYITQNKNYKVVSYAKLGYILQYYQKFLADKITKEEFFLVGDIYSKNKVFDDNLNLESLFEIDVCINDSKITNSIYIIDEIAKKYYESKIKGGYQKLEKQIEKSGNKIFII